MENDLLFCSILKLMFTNGKIIVYKFMIQFYYLEQKKDRFPYVQHLI
jgi:hypothetical protein